MFANIGEITNETNDDTKKILRQFMHENMKIAKDSADSIDFDRVHRMGFKKANESRAIVAKFHRFKGREYVRKQAQALKGTIST